MSSNSGFTRRQFLETTFIGTIVAGGVCGQVLAAPLIQITVQKDKSVTRLLSKNSNEVLRAALDELIPESDGMPAATDVGTEHHIERVLREDSSLLVQFQLGLRALNLLSRKRFVEGFVKLSRSQRVEVLSDLEKLRPKFFEVLRDFAYEGYYLQPRIWNLIGYEFYTSENPAPLMKPFDDAILANVRKLPKLYREVPCDNRSAPILL